MPKDMIDLPVLGRAAEVRPGTINEEARTAEIVWTTGARVARMRFQGWDIVEYDEELAVEPGAVRLERLNGGAPFLNSHAAWRLENVIGVVERGTARLEGGKGYATIRFSEREEVEPIWRDIRDGIISNVSVGYRVHRFEIEKVEGERELWRAVDWEPMEISAVAIGADPGAHVRSEGSDAALFPCVLTRQDGNAAQAAITTKEGQMSEENQRAAGGENAAAREEAGGTSTTVDTRAGEPTTSETRTATESGERENRSQPESGPSVEQAIANERQRVADISALCRRHGIDDVARDDLITRGVPIDEARSAVLDKLAEREPFEGRVSENAPAQARRGGERETQYRDALSSALLHRFDPGRHQLGDGAREFRGMSLMELARSNLERRGVDVRGMSKTEIAGLALAHRSAGYHSTSDFAAILANVANKTLRSAYDTTPRTFSAWARRTTIVDFKPVQRTQLGGAPDLEKVLESGEFQYGTIGEAKEVYALATYGRIVGITRQTLINDDLDAFTRVPAAFGASAADLESDIVYAILTQNPAMGDGTDLFHADHGNLGSASVIDEDALAAAYRSFGAQKGLEDRLIRVVPRHIIVPPGVRSVEARKQITSTTPANTQDVNAFAGRLEVVEEPRLIPDSGEDPWFLAADPARVDTVEYAYLDGQEGVYTETRSGFEVDGLEIKARHDFAAKAIDWRGLYKNAGASAT